MTPDFQSPPTSVGIDIGYGHTKVVVFEGSARPRTFTFPSYTPSGLYGTNNLEAPKARSMRVLPILVGSRLFHIGEDSRLVGDPRAERTRLDDYAATASYEALMLGALAMTQCPRIDSLVLGLPLTTIGSFSALLETTYQGDVNLGGPTVAGSGSVKVDRVRVVAQPVGALVHAGMTDARLANPSSVTLVIDLGYFTLDALVCEGMQAVPGRATSVEGGISSYIDALQAATAEAYAQLYPQDNTALRLPHVRYEAVLQAAAPEIQTSNGPVPLEGPRALAASALVQALESMKGRLGSLHDVTHAVLTGGGASILEPVFRARFPNIASVSVSPDPQLAIATGYAHLASSIIGAAHK